MDASSLHDDEVPGAAGAVPQTGDALLPARHGRCSAMPGMPVPYAALLTIEPALSRFEVLLRKMDDWLP